MATRRIPFLDLRITNDDMRRALLKAVDTVFRHGIFILGPEVEELERSVAAYCDRKYAVGVGSGTEALILGLKSLGIGPGDEVITPALSWIATANAIVLAGATPVFAEIGNDLNIDPDSVRKLITTRTKAIVPVHYTGKVCRMPELMPIAQEHGLFLVEDAAQAFGARYRGRPAGSFGELACFSMNPMKVFGACGEAGMVATDRKDLFSHLVSLRYNGMVNREVCMEPSLNGRIDTLQAAILLERFRSLPRLVDRRRQIAAVYTEQLAGLVQTPHETEDEWDVYYTYTVRTDKRDRLKPFLEDKGIEVRIRDPYLMPDQPAYRLTARGDFPNARRLVNQMLCLPAHENMSGEDVQYVVACIKEFFELDNRRAVARIEGQV